MKHLIITVLCLIYEGNNLDFICKYYVKLNFFLKLKKKVVSFILGSYNEL